MLIIITLLVFLVLLLIGLATVTRVETAVAGNTQRQAQARENALLALNLAVAHLQKYAGPDTRVTATADAFANTAGTKHYTGVWDTTQPASTTPATWLVSGNEVFKTPGDTTTNDPLATTYATSLSTTGATPTAVELVGKNSTGTASDVVAPLVPITATSVPGTSTTAAATIGRYAWWIGDQGVKAPVALGDPTATAANFNYAPYDSAETLSRIRQQISLGAGAADATGAPAFEPRDANNSSLVAKEKVAAFNQLAFLKTPTNATVGLATLQKNFHTWSPNNFNVLANTRLGGLRQDLSLFSGSSSNPNPSPLGSGYDAWANYDPANGGYMEDPKNPAAPAPLTAYGADPLRRRYIMQPADSAYGISPVLSFFGLSVSIHNNDKSANPTSLQVSVRCVAELWNPFSSALVPPDDKGLQLRITGLPTAQIVDTLGTPYPPIDLQAVMGGSSLNFLLPWAADGTNDDRSSWLPGRVYDWSALSNDSDPGDPGNLMQFYLRDSTPAGGSGVVRTVGPPMGRDTLVGGGQNYRHIISSGTTTLKIELWRVSDGKLLATFLSPQFSGVNTDFTTRSTGDAASDFAYIFRMPDALEIPVSETATWLQAAGRDPREITFPSSGYVVARGQPPQPELLVTAGQAGFSATYPDLLLDRYTDSASENYTEDVPIFELPRAPILSVGMLQHLRIPGARPFAIGNSWTNGVQLNGIKVDELFDRFFFSGLATGVTPAKVNGSFVLPNPLLKVLRDPVTGAATTVADLQSAPNAVSAKFLLEGGAFNLNSVNSTAWAAVLRGVRFGTGFDVNYLDASSTTGTADDASTAVAGFTGAAFLRFPQSAQEVYKADENYTQSTPSPPGPVINTPLYRRGVRVLSANEVLTLADAIVTLIQQRQSTSGPFRHLEEFLNPASPGNPSLLEQAIVNANINTNVAEFSAQWLTQGDIMTALAPVLFPRSDTFVVRTYGEAVNPVTTATEGRAWCEAIVQRVPDYFDPTDPAETAPASFDIAVDPTDPASTPSTAHQLNKAYGRRFKIISFRWLTRSDI